VHAAQGAGLHLGRHGIVWRAGDSAEFGGRRCLESRSWAVTWDRMLDTKG
jgi:hypothetical protein